MSDGGFHTWGTEIQESQVRIQWLRRLKDASCKHPRVEFRRYVEDGELQGVEIDYRPELPQYPPVGIVKTERLVVAVASNRSQLKFFALRKEFPTVPHLNASEVGKPRDLCLFEDRYSEIRHTLTPVGLLDRVGDWLTRAAEDRLHLAGQPLEPLIQTPHFVVFDEALLATPLPADKAFFAYSIDDPLDPSQMLLKVLAVPRSSLDKLRAHGFLPFFIQGGPRRSAVIERCPVNLEQLCVLLRAVGFDLRGPLRKQMEQIYDAYPKHVLTNYRPMLLLRLPKCRNDGGPIEAVDWYAFLVGKTVGEVGEALDCLQRTDRGYGKLLPFVPRQDRDLSGIPVAAANPLYELTVPFAKRLSGLTGDYGGGLLAVGVGALGSQVVLNLARQGVGPWVLFDQDDLRPHNLARHAMLPVHTGKSKADCLAKEVSALLGAPSFAEGIVADALSEQGEEEILKRSLTAERILDFSVSQAVTLQLSKMNLTKPCTSIFMTRDGQYLVSLSEGPERSLTVGDLETQLAAACLERRPLREVLATPESTEIRYSGACSAHTTVLPQDVVAVHAGIASQFVKALPTDADASIVVWHLDPAMQTLDRQDVVPSPVHSVAVNGWQVRVAHRTLAKLRRWRRSRLPNETGGVLLGTFDMVGKVAYVSAALPSPPDSREWPICYIRGVAGLSSQVQSIMKLTGEHLSYVGEWHSHPDKCGPEPSPDDKAALVLLAKEMGGVGLPAIMVIVGESGVPHVGLLE